MANLNSLLTALNSSSPKGWGSSSTHTWGGKSAGFKIAKFGKKSTESQAVANKIMAGAKVKASHSRESLLGSILGGADDVAGNLVSDIVSTAENTPSGLLKIATTNPVTTAKMVGKDYSTRYSSLLHGHLGAFAHQVAEHPLSYGLDAFTIGTLGAGGLAKAGVLSSALETRGLSLDRAATSAGESARVPVNLSRNPLTRAIQKGTYGLQAKLPQNIPVLGERAAASRAVGQEYQHEIAGMDPAGKTAVREAFKGHFGEAGLPALGKYNHVVGPGGLLGRSTQYWKDIVLAGRPAFIWNNIVGNTGMAGSVLGRHFFRAQQLATKGELNAAADKFFSGSMHSFGGTEQGAGTNFIQRTARKSYNLQGKPETMQRKAIMYSTAMKTPEIKAVVRHYTGQGMSEGKALEQAFTDLFKGEHGAALKREIRQKVDDTMGDYTRYTAGEQQLKKFVPFYGWNRHSSRFLYATARDRPGQLLVLNQLSRIGKQAHNQWGFQGTPDFMNGYLRIGGHTFDSGVLNPLKGGTDTLKSVKELVSGNPAEGTDLSGNLNPFIAAAGQAIAGKSFLTGAPIPRTAHGLLGSVGDQIVTGLPQVKLAKSLIPGQGGLDTSNPHTFLTATGRLKTKFVNQDTGHVTLDEHGFPVETTGRHMQNPTTQSLIASFVGIPDRGKVNLEVARTVAKKIATDRNGEKFRAPKKRKKTGPSFKSVTTTRSGGWGAGQSGWGG